MPLNPALDENGVIVDETVALPPLVIVAAYVLLSIIVELWQVNKVVFVIAVSAEFGTAKEAVYRPVPFNIRKLLIYPSKYPPAPCTLS